MRLFSGTKIHFLTRCFSSGHTFNEHLRLYVSIFDFLSRVIDWTKIHFQIRLKNEPMTFLLREVIFKCTRIRCALVTKAALFRVEKHRTKEEGRRRWRGRHCLGRPVYIFPSHTTDLTPSSALAGVCSCIRPGLSLLGQNSGLYCFPKIRPSFSHSVSTSWTPDDQRKRGKYVHLPRRREDGITPGYFWL